MIIIPSNRFIDGEMPEVHLGMEGWFTMQALKNGRVIREHAFPEHNIITNLGLEMIGSLSGENFLGRIHVGTGTAVPDATNTQLANWLSVVSPDVNTRTSGNSGPPDYYSWSRYTATSTIGFLGNAVLTEVGMSSYTTNQDFWSRDLIRDSAGTPSTFPIASDEQLRVVYELRVYPPLSDSLATVMVGPNSHDTISRALDISGSSWFPAWAGFFESASTNMQSLFTGDLVNRTDASPTGSIGNCNSIANATYGVGNHYRDISATWNAGNATSNNIRTARRAFGTGLWQVQYDPPIQKGATQILTLNQRASWARR